MMEHGMTKLLWTEIDLDVIAQNMRIIRDLSKSKYLKMVQLVLL